MLDSLVAVALDSTKTRMPKPVVNFKMPSAAFVLTPAQRAEYLLQDQTQLLAETLPLLPLVTGEVGWPRYIAAGELPSRAITTMVDSVWWMPGVYGNVDLTSLPEAANTSSVWSSLPSWFISSHGAAGSLRLASDTMNFSQPLSSAEYSKGPFGADAVRVNFSRAFSQRITGVLHATFSNSGGQFVDFPYDGHKATGKFDYRLTRNWRARYRHFNTRNEAGIAVPFFIEEQPELTNARHKEERLYHGVELEQAHAFVLRLFSWQIKEELFDNARLVRHRLRDWGGEGVGQWQRERFALVTHARLGSEEVRSTSIVARSRFYQEVAANVALRFHEKAWLQGSGQFRHKQNWPTGYSFALTGFYQTQKETLFWLKGGLYQIPPALAERDNALPYLARNEKLQAVRLQHAQVGARAKISTLALHFTLGNAVWQRELLYATDSTRTAFPEFGDSVQVAYSSQLRHRNRDRNALGAQMSLAWQPAPRWRASAHAAFAQAASAKHFWFWYQPESYARAALETKLLLFKKTIEALPRLSVNYLGARRSPVFAATSTLPRFETASAVTTLDFNLRILYGDGALFFSWENLLDERFDLREGVPHPGRVFRWGFWWKFLN